MSPLAMTHTDKPEMAALYRAEARHLRWRVENLKAAHEEYTPAILHSAYRHMLVVAQELEQAADECNG